jgi:hypothetical protein
MTAASGAARATQELADRPGYAGSVGLALAIIVAGGLVEGLALGGAQAGQLARWHPALRRGRYVAATVLVAGLGWALASAPSALAGDDGGSGPPMLLMALGGAGIGLAMGPLLGAAQAWALRGAVEHPWRWVGANTAAWPLAMAVIFVGAGTPAADWPLAWLLLDGAATGALAGAVLGLVSGWFLDSLTGSPVRNQVVLHLLGGRRRVGLDHSLIGLEVHGRRTGRAYRLPVQYAAGAGDLVVVPGRAERKSWWRNLAGPVTPVEALVDGAWRPATAALLRPGDDGYAEALAVYRSRWARVRLPEDQPVVRVRVDGPG